MPETPAPNPTHDARLARAIARWYKANARPLPWRTTPRDPWLSLMSEVLLQQTQAARVAERFETFARTFPTPGAMAAAPLDDVLALWSGLGYYRRAALLHNCARAIVKDHQSTVPPQHDALLALPGVGRYTAGAVASIVFGQPQPIVDGNVARVLMRLHGVEQSPQEKAVRAWTWQRATDLVGAAGNLAAQFNEGLMELGATVCTPNAPKCQACPCSRICKARLEGLADQIPMPKTKTARRPLAISAMVIADDQGRIWLEQRPARGLWAGLWQPPTVERDSATPPARGSTLEALGLTGLVEVVSKPTRFEMATSHRSVYVRVWMARAIKPGTIRPCRSRDVQRVQAARWVVPDTFASLGLGSVQRRMLSCVGLASFGPTIVAKRAKAGPD